MQVQVQTQKSSLTLWFASLNAFQNGMTRPSSTHDHRGDRLQGKGLNAGPVVTGGDWALVVPTPKLAATSLLSPENFVQIGPSVQKLFMIFQNTDTQTNHPCTITGTGEIFLCPVFSTLSQNGVSFRITEYSIRVHGSGLGSDHAAH